MLKLLQVAVAGLAAVSFSALAADKATEVDANTKIQGDNAGAGASAYIDKTDKKKAKKAKKGTAGAGGSTAGPTDNPNVTRDAQGREHVNKGKHTGQLNKDESGAKVDSSASGSTSGSVAAPAPAPAPTTPSVEAPKKAE